MNEAGMLAAVGTLVRRDLLLALRRRGETANPLLFFFVVVSLFPLGVGPERHTLASLAPGLIWVAALLATLLAMDNLFRPDFDDGTLEQMLLSPQPLTLLVSARVLAHWLVSGLPLLVCAPVLAYMLALPVHALPVLLASLALGTPVLSLVGAIGVALTVGLRRGGGLLALLVLPLYVPVLVFATSAVGAAASGLPTAGPLYVLGALLALAVSLAPVAIAAALRISLS